MVVVRKLEDPNTNVQYDVLYRYTLHQWHIRSLHHVELPAEYHVHNSDGL